MTTDIAVNGTIASVLLDEFYRVNTHFNVIKNSLSFR